MGYDITTDKTRLSYPVLVEDVKEQLNIEESFNKKDNLLQGFIKAATAEAEAFCNKTFGQTRNVSQVWDFSGDYVRIWEAPMSTIESVSSGTVDDNDTHAYHEYFDLTLTDSLSSTDPLTITYLTGYTPEGCPDLIKQSIIIKVADYYDLERQSYIPNGLKNNQVFERLLSTFKSNRFISS